MGKILNTNTRCHPSEQGGRASITAVLVEGVVGDYAVYVGFGSPEYIAQHGDKLSFDEAKMHFPGIEKENYRR